MTPSSSGCFYQTPHALVLALASSTKFEQFYTLEKNQVSTRLRSRVDSELCEAILGNLGMSTKYLHSVDEIPELFGEHQELYIELALFNLVNQNLRNVTIAKKHCLSFGADSYLANFTMRTFLGGIYGIHEWMNWKKEIQDLSVKSIVLPEKRKSIKSLAGIVVDNVANSDYRELTTRLQTKGFFDQFLTKKLQTQQLLIFGITENEYSSTRNQNKINSKLDQLDLKNAIALIKLHPNVDINSKIIKNLGDFLEKKDLEYEFNGNTRHLPLELLLNLQNVMHFFGLKSSALLTLPPTKYTSLIPSRSRKRAYKLAYLNSDIV